MAVLNSRVIPFIGGLLMSINFLIFWAIPIAAMGQAWKLGVSKLMLPIYRLLDENSYVRDFAGKYIYTNPKYADYFVTSIFLILGCSLLVSFAFYWQLSFGSMPLWLIFTYNCLWVGFGGRTMGAAYSLAHREGHNLSLYQKWIRNNFGNIMENWIGCFYGNIPYNFTTSHIFIHHKVDGGVGDTFYEWDIDRSSLFDFVLYVYRIFLHVIGISSLKLLYANGQTNKAELLLRGIGIYWAVGCGIYFLTKSWMFVFWIYIEPMLCMSYFLALLNIGYHGFLEYDENGISIPCVNSTCIIDGDDDTFGEDDHMSHHYNTNVYYRDLPVLQQSKMDEFIKYKASVFQKISIVELSIYLILGIWDKLADHYCDFSGKMTKEEIIDMLKTRASRIEMSYDDYESYMTSPSTQRRKELEQEIKYRFGKNNNINSDKDDKKNAASY